MEVQTQYPQLEERKFDMEDVEVIDEEIDDFADIQKTTKIYTINDLHALIAKLTNFDQELLRSKSRKRELAYPRFVAYYLAFYKLNMALESIGDFYNGRDHSTVINGRNLVIEALEIPKRNKKLYELFDYIASHCQFSSKGYMVCSKHNGNRWEKFIYKKTENIVQKNRYMDETRKFIIFDGQIIEDRVIKHWGLFKARLL